MIVDHRRGPTALAGKTLEICEQLRKICAAR
jgi:hypothetical protein